MSLYRLCPTFNNCLGECPPSVLARMESPRRFIPFKLVQFCLFSLLFFGICIFFHKLVFPTPGTPCVVCVNAMALTCEPLLQVWLQGISWLKRKEKNEHKKKKTQKQSQANQPTSRLIRPEKNLSFQSIPTLSCIDTSHSLHRRHFVFSTRSPSLQGTAPPHTVGQSAAHIRIPQVPVINDTKINKI